MSAVAPSKTVFVVLGNQLFPFQHVKPYRGCTFFMAEDMGLCTYVRHHKQKIVMFLASMRAYRDMLRDYGCTVHYEQLDPEEGRNYETKLGEYLDGKGVERLVTWEIADRFFERRVEALAERRGLMLQVLPSPMFLTPRDAMTSWLDEHRPFMASFYQWQRKRLNVLMNSDGSPRGGRWSFDDENRQSLPPMQPVPDPPVCEATDHVRRLIPLINERFADHPGELSESTWWLATTRRAALAQLRKFLDERFEAFGPFEDALSTRGPVLFHSTLSPYLNMGLITPDEVLQSALDRDVPLNSLEGFVRQIIGWREFVFGIDRQFGSEQAEANQFDHHRKLGRVWYNGDTGLPPLDDVIAKCNRYGWAHHIERLMVVGNLMLLCEIDPREAYRWFMEMFIDSSDWVMGPNVYGMSQHSDGGIFATKPYICGSNYILKMSDYAKGDWCDVIDGLYWRFVDRQRDFLSKNARMGRAVSTFDRMNAERWRHILAAAERFIERSTATR